MAARQSLCKLVAGAKTPTHARLSLPSFTRLTLPASRVGHAVQLSWLPSQRRWDSTAAQPWRLWGFKQIQDLSQTSEKSRTVIIDVREPHEYIEGHIPKALNMPINSAPEGLFLSPEDFEDRFGFAKPEPDTPVVFYCKAGIRSKGAAIIATDAGLKDIKEYRPSFDDWVANNGAIERGKPQSS